MRPQGRAVHWALFSLGVSVLLVALKAWGFWATGSAALLSDALESLVNIVTSGFALYAVWLSSLPRDSNHPYGHGKVEYLSAIIEGLLVAAAGVGIVALSAMRLFNPVPLERMGVGAGVALVAAAIAFAAGTALIRAGRSMSSPTIEADGIHVRADSITSLGAFIGATLVWLTGLAFFDAAVALLLGGWLMWHGLAVVRKAVGGLMDEASPELLDAIAETLRATRRPGWILPHATKVHRLGQTIHIDLHYVFPRFWTLERAHDACHVVEDALRERFGRDCEVMINAESCDPTNCAHCDLADCPVRAAPCRDGFDWNGRWIARRSR